MTQASGSRGRYSYVAESTWGTTPGSPTMKLLAAALFGGSLGSTIEQLTSNAISGTRGLDAVRGGNIAAAGSVPFELPLVGIGELLKHALGTATSGRNASMAAGVTGVTVRYAQSTCPTGAGTLTRSGSNLTWQANGDGSAGAAVDVSAGGEFTLQSGSANHALYVTVTTAGGTSSTVTVSSTQYKHIIRRGTLPAGLTIEEAFIDIAQYFVFTGCKINQMSLQVQNSGFITGSFDFIGKQVSASGTSLGSPTTFTHTPFVQQECTLLEGGSTANIIGTNLNLTNELDGNVRYVGSRYIGSLPEGKGQVGGDITAAFEDLTYVNKALNETESSLKLTFTTGSDYIEILAPKVKYFGDATPKLTTAQGIIVPLTWVGYKDSVTQTDLQITIVNTSESAI